MPVKNFWRNASNCLVFTLDEAPADNYKLLCDAIADAFGLVPHSSVVSNGYDIVFQDYARGEQIVSLEWDNWFSFMVVAESPQSEALVQEIGTWLLQSEWANKC